MASTPRKVKSAPPPRRCAAKERGTLRELAATCADTTVDHEKA
ncbi:hypothetical protein ACIQNI_13395 [Streptomyces sp. NPDC091266]